MALPVRLDSVGSRVHVYWVDEDAWFAGRVQDVDASDGYYVVYDDGDERWESPAQLVRFADDSDGGEGVGDPEEGEKGDNEGVGVQEEDERAVAMPRSSHAPQMLEPPASPADAYESEDGDSDDGEAAATTAIESGDDLDNEGYTPPTSGAKETRWRQSADIERQGDDDDDAGEQHHEQEVGMESDSDADEQSIATSEVPITFERKRGRVNSTTSIQLSARSSASKDTSRSSKGDADPLRGFSTSTADTARLPVCGVLRGKVLCARNLPSLPSPQAVSAATLHVVPPRAFVKVAFVEASESGTATASSLMLRCKSALSTTSVAPPSCSPTWNDEVCDDEAVDGGFQMQLAPVPANVPSTVSGTLASAWLQLRGDFLFSVYAASEDEGGDSDENSERGAKNRRGNNHDDFIGQAVLSLPALLREALVTSSALTRHLPLQSRQGKTLATILTRDVLASQVASGGSKQSTRGPEIVVSLEFAPTYSEDLRQRSKSSRSSTPAATLKRPTSATSQPKSISQKLQPQQTQQHKKAPSKQAKDERTHTSSSAVNRKKLAKQIDQQNAAFAKRIEWQHERRTRLADQAKAQAKSSHPVPQHGTMKRDHTPSSRVNRSRFQQQVHDENRAMEKRLHAITRKGDDNKPRSRGAAVRSDDVRFDASDKDALLACERRQQRLREQDFVAMRAQAAYRKQSALVEEVAALQADVAELRSEVADAKAAATRLDILTNKDEHLCKCLRSAADASEASSRSSSDTSSAKVAKRRVPTDEDAGAECSRQRKELELLRNEAAGLDADKQRRSQELRTCNARTQELDDEIHRLGAQLRFVQDKQAFERRMTTSKASTLEQQQQGTQRRHQRLELSRNEEEHWKLFQAQQELTQLQIAVQVAKDRKDASSATTVATTTLSTAACAYLEKKIARQQQKLEQLESEQRHWQQTYEALAASGEYEALRTQVHELQQTLFLCQAQQKQLAAAQRRAAVAGERLAGELQKQAFEQQTETDVVLKRRR